jgi:hypothetical protein
LSPAVNIEGVIDGELFIKDFVIILQAQGAEALGDGLQPRRFGPPVQVVINISPMYNLGE